MSEEASNIDSFKKPDESKIFHNRVKKIFVCAGFEIIKSNYYSKGADIIVKVDNKKIIIQCKCAQSDEKVGLNIDGLIDEYSKKADREGAERAILAISRYKIPKNYLLKQEKENRAIFDKVVIWDDKTIEYYEEVVSALNKWAKYTIIGDMYISSKFGDPIFANAIKVHQGESEFFVFKISPEELLKMAYIFRRDYNRKEAYQRALNIKRLKSDISEFLDGPEAILPTNLIGVFDSDVKIKNGKLKIPRQYKSFWIIDGQHRLYSFCYTKDNLKRKNFELICVGLDGRKYKESEQAKLFVEINDESKKIPKLLLYDLYELMGKPEIRIELVKSLARNSKVFKDKIKVHRKDKGEISLVSFVNTTPMKKLINERNGDLTNLFRERIRQNPNYSDQKMREKCKVFYSKVLEEYFSIIKENFPGEWEDNQNYILSTDRGIRVLLRLLRELYRHNRIHGEKTEDPKIFNKVIPALKEFDFSKEILKGMYFGEGGADLFLEKLKEHIHKEVPDFFPKESKRVLSVVDIDAGEKDKANKFLSQWIPLLGREIYGELAYVNRSTIDYLSGLPKGSSIKLFVGEIRGGGNEFKIRCENLKKEGFDIKIKRISRKPLQKGQNAPTYLHGRWIGGNNLEIEPGFDLKSDGIGNKKDRMIAYRTGNSERINNFKERWNALSKFKMDVIIEDVI
jgi:DNA sulfur modification protein DndB